MGLQIYYPKPPLSTYVEMFWYWDGYHMPHARERILPHGAMEITINLDELPFIVHREADDTPQKVHGAMVIGNQSQHYLIDTSRPMTLLSVYFKAGAAKLFFGVAADELHNLHVPLDMLWGQVARDLYHQLLESQSVGTCFALLENVLLERLTCRIHWHDTTATMLHALNQSFEFVRIETVMQDIPMSKPRLIHLFREDVGMTPKRYSRVQRFQQTLNYIVKHPDKAWSDIALICGYYDQSHFINEFRALAGIRPTEYNPQSTDHIMNLPVLDIKTNTNLQKS